MSPPSGKEPGAAAGESDRHRQGTSEAEGPGRPAEEPLAESADDDVLPISPRSRRLATVIAFVIIAAILVFLAVFIATHTEQSDGGSMLGFGGASDMRSGVWPDADPPVTFPSPMTTRTDPGADGPRNDDD